MTKKTTRTSHTPILTKATSQGRSRSVTRRIQKRAATQAITQPYHCRAQHSDGRKTNRAQYPRRRNNLGNSFTDPISVYTMEPSPKAPPKIPRIKTDFLKVQRARGASQATIPQVETAKEFNEKG
ncbi:hypothetical protein BJ508DRAFT_304036 [Ascobolus immersus RN42]|uniref:Uncharacterized protein n=1 Tax=Ascobolus immersus RN42 TaxID=1160509 RepID=A0A3N4IF35_ASCIM|nr:hypothetical protein BJ508DRAFT_304036 [Ascobolus immersus RN42]